MAKEAETTTLLTDRCDFPCQCPEICVYFVSRGAKMISRMLKRKISKQRAQQLKDLRTIREKIERIRLRTHRLGGSARDNWQHFDGKTL